MNDDDEKIEAIVKDIGMKSLLEGLIRLATKAGIGGGDYSFRDDLRDALDEYEYWKDVDRLND